MSFWGGVVGKTILSTRLRDVRIALDRDEIVAISGFHADLRIEPIMENSEPTFVPADSLLTATGLHHLGDLMYYATGKS